MAADLAIDRHRPRYHFLPPANWMNDPNGLTQFRGRYHLFYQYNPNGAFWGTMHWGHAISEDLVLWRHLPIALSPDADGPDADGCFSGAAVVHDGVPMLVYTGVRGDDQLPCLATSEDDDLARWAKHPGNPVIPAPPGNLSLTIFRDHTLWREDGAWMMGIGSGIEGQGGAVLMYRSVDLVNWNYLHPLATENPALNPGGEVISTGWECPDFFFLDDAPVLVACDWDGDPISVSYWTGRYAGRRFIPARRGIVDAGACFYAPQSFRTNAGDRVMFGWLREMRPGEAQVDAGWSGAMSLPRTVRRAREGEVAFCVAPEVDRLRVRERVANVVDGEVLLDAIPGDCFELDVAFERLRGAPVRVQLRCTPDLEECTTIEWSPINQDLSLDTRRSSLDPVVTGEIARCPLALLPGERLDLRVFVDRSVVEVFANDRVVISGRVYPTREASIGVRVEPATALAMPPRLYEMSAAIDG